MAKFKVGDRIAANDRTNGRYSTTCERNGFVGFVTKVNYDGSIVVRGTTKYKTGLCCPFTVDPECFDLIEPIDPKNVFQYKVGEELVPSEFGLEVSGFMLEDDRFIVEKRHKDGTITCSVKRSGITRTVDYTWVEREKPLETPDSDILRFLFT